MLCAKCNHQWTADLDWIDRWDQALEVCPGCGLTCEAEDAPRVTVDPHDLALTDDNLRQLAWYHTSTQPDWPTQDFDPAAELTQETRQMMGGDENVVRWAERQKAKAFHVGTYESAIHNMLRRMDNQADHGKQFYLYRVRLVPKITVREGWLIDPSNFVGDVVLNEVCPPGIGVARYLNYHEDPGAISLALGRNAIHSTQQIAIPPLSNEEASRMIEAIRDFSGASVSEATPRDSRPVEGRIMPSPLTSGARELAALLAGQLPVNLRRQFESVLTFNDDMAPEWWAEYAVGLIGLVQAPSQILSELVRQPLRQL